MVITTAFLSLVDAASKAWGWTVPLATIEHPLGGTPVDQLGSRADAVAQKFFDLSAGAKNENFETSVEAPRTLLVPSDPWDFYDFAMEQRWSDGFPVFAPTPDRVDRMLAANGIDPDEFIGNIPPEELHVTARDVAVNAVLAGCPDAALPVVIAAMRAACQKKFNLLGATATTHPCTLTTIVSGPIAKKLGINSGSSAFGQGNRMNATIGRAVRLCAQNLGRAWPGDVDKSTQGSPAKYSFCFAENLDASPWNAHHTDRGFDDDVSTVTMTPSEGPHNVHDSSSSTAENIITYLATSMSHAGHNNLYHRGDMFVVLCPEHAHTLADEGWSRDRVRHEIFERALVPASGLGGQEFKHILSRWLVTSDMTFETGMLTVTDKPEDINIVVAGGSGKHSSWIPSFAFGYSATEEVK